MNLWHDARAVNTVANGLVMVAFACLAGTAVWWLAQRSVFDLKAIEVGPVGRALEHVNAEALGTAGVNELAGNFFTVDLGRVRQAFEDAPWVRRAQVRRIWPNRLFVGIEEQRVLARWSDGRFVNTYGELFSVDPAQVENQDELLDFAGPEGTQQIVTRRWVELQSQLASLAVKPREVLLSDRQAWTARLDNGVTLLMGRDEGLSTSERVARWVAVNAQVQARLGERAEVVDLRYPNGFAVRAPGSLENEGIGRNERTEQNDRNSGRNASRRP